MPLPLLGSVTAGLRTIRFLFVLLLLIFGEKNYSKKPVLLNLSFSASGFETEKEVKMKLSA
jgi:hypothetical protein